jgi:hypothetical protein
MANPATTTRLAPVGFQMGNGFPFKVAFAADPDISFWEMTLQPPGVDGGDSIDITTQHNVVCHTKHPRTLMDWTDAVLTVAWDPRVYPQIAALINVATSVTILFPDGDTLDFFGFLRSFIPQEMSDGNMPLAQVIITPMNFDVANCVEACPVWTPGAGTC